MTESIQEVGEEQFTGKFLTPFQRKLLEKTLREELSEAYRQRLSIMILADENKTQSEICKALNCCAATARHWILIAKMGMAHQWQEQPVGRPHIANHQYRERLKELVNQNPQTHGYAFQRWTGHWLSKHLAKELSIEINERQVNRILKQMGLSTRQESPLASNSGDSCADTTNKLPTPHILIQDLSAVDRSTTKSRSLVPITQVLTQTVRSAP
jgi:transposase